MRNCWMKEMCDSCGCMAILPTEPCNRGSEVELHSYGFSWMGDKPCGCRCTGRRQLGRCWTTVTHLAQERCDGLHVARIDDEYLEKLARLCVVAVERDALNDFDLSDLVETFASRKRRVKHLLDGPLQLLAVQLQAGRARHIKVGEHSVYVHAGVKAVRGRAKHSDDRPTIRPAPSQHASHPAAQTAHHMEQNMNIEMIISHMYESASTMRTESAAAVLIEAKCRGCRSRLCRAYRELDPLATLKTPCDPLATLARPLARPQLSQLIVPIDFPRTVDTLATLARPLARPSCDPLATLATPCLTPATLLRPCCDPVAQTLEPIA